MKAESQYIDVLGSKMHVTIAGEGDPVLFLHGNPANGFLWRNIFPYVTDSHQAIVPDLIGMGKSDKPDIEYTYADQYKYLEALIDALDLKNITLVLHDWGSGLGFNYFANHSENVKAIAFMEGILKDVGTYFPPEMQKFFTKLRSDDEGWQMIGSDDTFMQEVFPTWSVRDLSSEEFEGYYTPFRTVESRKVIHQWVRHVPFNGEPKVTADIVENYRNKLQKSDIPKLFFYATPGVFMPESVANWVKENIPNLEAVHVGEGTHFLQEDHPGLIGEKVKEWLNKK